ncbi:hypothetical protein C8R46DRAFT_1093746 [Mycena filopes]|nr:hypothetical protein C8R46DRAFT_1093746 [Mycena filopes]
MSTAALRKRLVELDAKIIEQKAVLDALETDRSAVQQELEDTSVFPILTLPVEVTTEIFTWCLPAIDELREDHASRRDGKPAEPHAPLTLASCCRLWRAIALATPALWMTFPLFFHDASFTKRGREDLTLFIDRWLGRAAAIHPLTFVFHIPPPLDPYYDYENIRPSLHCVQAALHRYAQRLEHLDLVTNVFDVRPLLHSNSVDFPLLQRIVIGVDQDDVHHAHYQPSSDTSLGEAPQFCELLLRESAFLSSYSLPLDRLTRFEGGIDDLRLFQLAPNLIEAKCCFEVTEWTQVQSDITHSRVQSLTLSSLEPGDPEPWIEYLLAELTLPALLSLDLPHNASTDGDYIQAFLRRSKPPLKSLAVRVDVDATWEDADSETLFEQYGNCFSAVAVTLEKLDIYSPSPAFMSTLWRRGYNNHDFLPQLKSLALIDCPAVDYKLLLPFLYPRSTSPDLTKLESLKLQFSNGINPGILDGEQFAVPESDGTPRTIAGHLRELESCGMSIQIGSSSVRGQCGSCEARSRM